LGAVRTKPQGKKKSDGDAHQKGNLFSDQTLPGGELLNKARGGAGRKPPT